MKYKRDVLTQLEALLNSDEIILLTGARQIGKTTLLHQLKNNHLNIISISNCNNISDSGMGSLISSSLIDLQLISCQNMHGLSLLKIPSNAKISIYNCNNISLDILQRMKKRNINLLTDRFNT